VEWLRAPAVGHARQDADAQPLGSGLAAAALANEEEELSGVVDAARTVRTAVGVIPEGGQQLVLQLVVEEQEKYFVGPLAVHAASAVSVSGDWSLILRGPCVGAARLRVFPI
jgi:hypothetical protein